MINQFDSREGRSEGLNKGTVSGRAEIDNDAEYDQIALLTKLCNREGYKSETALYT